LLVGVVITTDRELFEPVIKLIVGAPGTAEGFADRASLASLTPFALRARTISVYVVPFSSGIGVAFSSLLKDETTIGMAVDAGSTATHVPASPLSIKNS
jgi:hypothetical protein